MTFDLAGLGELSAAIVRAFAELKGVEVDDADYEVVARATWERVKFMHDRAEFARSTLDDLEKL